MPNASCKCRRWDLCPLATCSAVTTPQFLQVLPCIVDEPHRRERESMFMFHVPQETVCSASVLYSCFAPCPGQGMPNPGRPEMPSDSKSQKMNSGRRCGIYRKRVEASVRACLHEFYMQFRPMFRLGSPA